MLDHGKPGTGRSVRPVGRAPVAREAAPSPGNSARRRGGLLALGLLAALIPGYATAQTPLATAVHCENISVEDCVRQLPLTVTMDKAMAARKVQINHQSLPAREMLGLILDAAGLTNYIIRTDQTGQHVTISDLGAGEAQGQAKAADPGQSQNTGFDPRHISGKEMEQFLKKGWNDHGLNQDANVPLPDGSTVSMRNLQAAAERGSLINIPPKTTISTTGDDKPITYEDIKKSQERADKAGSQPQRIVLPDGTAFSDTDVKAKHERLQGTLPNPNAAVAAANPTPPASPGTPPLQDGRPGN